MKITVIGGTGHIGTYLIPRLVNDGHEVICVSRYKRKPYRADPAWEAVKIFSIDRVQAENRGTFGDQIVKLDSEIVIDLICFTVESAKVLCDSLKGKISHFLHCGTMWVHGFSEFVPTTEKQIRKPFGEYGIQKAKIESYLLELHNRQNFPATILHPGHITGPGWLPINPAGNLDPKIFYQLARGEEIALPNLGMETLHHVHADDVAQAFQKAIVSPGAFGESFHIVSEQAMTLKGYAGAMADWFGKNAKLNFLSWEEWKNTVRAEDAALTWDHIAHSPNGSIEKAKRILGYSPAYTSLDAVMESVIDHFEKTGFLR